MVSWRSSGAIDLHITRTHSVINHSNTDGRSIHHHYLVFRFFHSLLCSALHTAVYFVALADGCIAVDPRAIGRVEVRAGGATSVALTAIARTAHHVFTQRAALLDGRL